jgi:hypothetical protein
MPLVFIFISYIGTVWRLIRSRFTSNISLEVCLWVCLLNVGSQLGCIRAVLVKLYLGLRQLKKLYPSLLLGADSSDTSQLPKEKNFHGQFQYFQITQPDRSIAVTPLYLCRGCQIVFLPIQLFENISPAHFNEFEIISDF